MIAHCTGFVIDVAGGTDEAEEGGFWAEIPAFVGCVSEGDTLEETMYNIREAAEGWLKVAHSIKIIRDKSNSENHLSLPPLSSGAGQAYSQRHEHTAEWKNTICTRPSESR